MNANISFTFADLWITVGLVFVMIVVVVLMLRYYFNRKATSELTTKYKEKKWKSPLEARNKYPDVDVFKFRNTMFYFSVIVVLGMTIAFFNWTTINNEADFEAFAPEFEVEI